MAGKSTGNRKEGTPDVPDESGDIRTSRPVPSSRGGVPPLSTVPVRNERWMCL